jgi:hypothetical protein
MDIGKSVPIGSLDKYIPWEGGHDYMDSKRDLLAALAELSDRMATRSDIEKLRDDVCDLKSEKGILASRSMSLESHISEQAVVIGELQKRVRSIEQWRWKIVGGMLVLATLGSTLGSAFTSFMLGK